MKVKITELESHKDSRGWLVELLKKKELKNPVKQLHIASLKKGSIRGNHYHSKREECFFIVSGKAIFVLEDIKTKERKSFNLSEKNQKAITIFPNIAHAVKNVGKETVYLISAQTDIYNPRRPDAYAYKVL